MNSRFRTEGQFRLFIRLILSAHFLSQIQLLPVNALNGVIWNKKSGNFVRIFSIKQFADIKDYYFSMSRAIETHDFNGTQFRLTAFPITNLFQFSNNDTKAIGIYGELWEILSEMLNFKILYIRSETNEYGNIQKDNSWDGLIGHIYRNETDIIPRTVLAKRHSNAVQFIMPVWNIGYKLCVEKRLDYDPVWMTKVFSPSIWASIFVLFIVQSIASFSLHVLSRNIRENFTGDFTTLRDHFFHIFTLLCNQGSVSPRLYKYSKIITVSTALFSWLIFIALNSKLISHITQHQFRAPFANLDRLYSDTTYKIVIKRNSLVFGAFRNGENETYSNIMKSKRLIQIGDETEAFQKMCTGKNAFFGATEIVRATNTKRCEIICIGRESFPSWVGSGVRRGFKNKRTIDLGVLKLHEVGIVKRLKKRWLMKTTEIRSSNSFESIRLFHVGVVFSILSYAIILSLGILLIEKIVYLKKHRKRRSKKSTFVGIINYRSKL